MLQEPIGILELRAVPAFSVAPNASIYGAVYRDACTGLTAADGQIDPAAYRSIKTEPAC